MARESEAHIPPATERGAREVLAASRHVLADLDLDTVLDRVLAAARELTGARYAALGVLDESRTSLARFVTAGIDEAVRREIGPPPKRHGVLGELISHPVPLRLRDVGAHPHSYGFPPGHPTMHSFLGVPVLVAGEPFGNLYLTDKAAGRQFTAADEDVLLLLAELAGVAIDHARRYTESEQRREELQRTVAALDATIQIAHAVGGQTDLDAILELIAKRGRALVSAGAVVIEYWRADELIVAAGAGDLPPDLLGQRIDFQGSVASGVLRTLQSQRLEHEPNRRRFERHGLGRLGLRAEAGLVVPLVFHGQPYGVLVAVDRLEEGPRFTADDERLLEAFAASAATAIATAESAELERRKQRLAATEEERGRWARELHDETLQGLAALRLGLAAAERAGSAEGIRLAVSEAVRQLEGEIANLRSLITDLRPAALDQLGLAAAVEALAERARHAGLDVDVHVELSHEQGVEADRPTPELETAVYRIAQEALTNARKHGAARRAVVEVVENGAVVRVSVRDDGSGFDPEAPTHGFGLIGMHERVELLDGSMSIASTPGKGTTVAAELPLRRRGSTDAVAADARA